MADPQTPQVNWQGVNLKVTPEPVYTPSGRNGIVERGTPVDGNWANVDLRPEDPGQKAPDVPTDHAVVNDYFSGLAKDIGAHYLQGEVSVQRALAGADVLEGPINEALTLGVMKAKTYEDYKDQYSVDNLSQQETHDYTTLGHFIAPAIESLPYLKDMGASGAEGAAAGAAVGTGLGSVGGPAAGLGFVAGGGIGFTAGSATSAIKTAAGGIYMDLRDAGVPDGVARAAAVTGGSVVGGLQFLRVAQLAGIGTKAITKQFTSQGGQKFLQGAIKNVLSRGKWMQSLGWYAKNVGIQTIEAEAQALAQIATETIAKVGTGISPGDLVGQIVSSFEQSLKASAVLVPAIHAGGAAIGKLVAASKTNQPLTRPAARAIHSILTNSDPQIPTEAEIQTRVEDWKAEQKIRKDECKNLRERVLKAINTLRPVTLDKPSSEATPKESIRAFNAGGMSWEGKLKDIAFQDASPAERQALANELETGETLNDIASAKRQAKDDLGQFLLEATGKQFDEVIRMLIQGAGKPLLAEDGKSPPRYLSNRKDAKGERSTESLTDAKGRPFTRNEAMKLYAQIHDETLHSGLTEGNGYTLNKQFEDLPPEARPVDTTENVLERLLTQDEKNIIKGIGSYYRKAFAPLEWAYFNETGNVLYPLENYSGPGWREGYRQDNLAEAFKAELETQRKKPPSARTGSTIERIDSKLPLAKRDIFFDVLEHIDSAKAYEGWVEQGRILRSVFTDPNIRKALSEKYGQSFLAGVDQHLTDAIQGVEQGQTSWNKFVQKIMEKAPFALLALRPAQYLSHALQSTNAMLFEHNGKRLPAMQYLESWFNYFNDPGHANDILNHSEQFQNRYANFDRALLGAVRRANISDLQKHQIKDFANLSLTAGDAHAVHAGGWAVYEWMLKQTDGDKTAALEAFDKYLNTTQTSGTVDQLSAMARNKDQKALTLFIQQPIRMWEHTVTAWREAANTVLHSSDTTGKAKAEAIYNAMRTTFYAHLSAFMFAAGGTAYKLMVSTDEKEKQQALWHLFMEGILAPQIPVFGPALVNTAQVIHNLQNKRPWDEHVHDTQILALQVVSKGSEFLGKTTYHTLAQDWDNKKFLEALQLYGESFNLLPYTGLGIPESVFRESRRGFKNPAAENNKDIVK